MSQTVSIVTINRNNRSGLIQTIDSVIREKLSYRSIQYIVVDGLSTDGSVEYLKSQSEHIDRLIIENDSGIFHAMNKGLNLAQGDYVLFLNSGDYLVNPLFSKIFNHYQDADILYGDCYFVTDPKFKQLYHHPENLSLLFFLNHSLNHQSTFIKTSLNKQCPYNEDFKLASDWEFFLRRIVFENATIRHIALPVCYYDLSGQSQDAENNRLLNLEKQTVLDSLHIDRILADYGTLNSLYRNGLLKYFQRKQFGKWRLLFARKLLSLLSS